MASTSIFAPQVRSVQPAFIYEGLNKTAKVYFNFSDYNSINDIGAVLFTLKNPSLASSYGSNSIIKMTEFDNAGYLCYTFSINEKSSTEIAPIQDAVYCIFENGRYIIQRIGTSFQAGVSYYKINNLKQNELGFYIEINLGEDIYKPLAVNSFYSMQLYFVDRGVNLNNQQSISLSWLKENENKISSPSQVTLLRPILQPNVVFEVDEDYTTYDFSKLKGKIEYNEGNKVETLDTYYCEVTKEIDLSNPTAAIIRKYTSKSVVGNGLDFEIPLDSVFNRTNKKYEGFFVYTTINGYSQKVSFSIELKEPEIFSGEEAPRIGLTYADTNANFIIVPFENTIAGDILERASKKDNYATWSIIKEIEDGEELIQDLNIESRVPYKYRIARIVSGEKYVSTPSNEVGVEIEDITISDSTALLTVRYNPNISGFKYVTQESIVNTLGGRYPIIRKNGDTKYRQFSLSGTLFFLDLLETEEVKDSQNAYFNNSSSIVGHWFKSENSLYLTQELALEYDLSYLDEQRTLETKVRQIAMNIMTNGKIKLFRSEEEGNMIVSLSNISFTPNKQLGRHVYDFSATVTEVCECSLDNIKKYNLQPRKNYKYIPFTESINTTLSDEELSNSGIFFDKTFEIIESKEGGNGDFN